MINKQFVFQSLFRGVSVLVSLSLVWLITREYNFFEIGRYYFWYSCLHIASTILRKGEDLNIAKEAQNESKETLEIMAGYFWISQVISFLSLIMIIGQKEYMFWYVVLGGMLSGNHQINAGYYRGLGEVNRSLIYESFGYSISFILIVYFSSLSLLESGLMSLISVNLALSLNTCKKLVLVRPKFTRKVPNFWTIGLVNAVMQHSDIILISYILGDVIAGEWGLHLRLVLPFSLTLITINSYLVAKLNAANNHTNRLGLLKQWRLNSLVLAILITIGLVLANKHILLFFNETLSVHLTAVMIVSGFFLLATGPNAVFLQYSGQEDAYRRIILKISFTSMLLMATSIILFKKTGLMISFMIITIVKSLIVLKYASR